MLLCINGWINCEVEDMLDTVNVCTYELLCVGVLTSHITWLIIPYIRQFCLTNSYIGFLCGNDNRVSCIAYVELLPDWGGAVSGTCAEWDIHRDSAIDALKGLAIHRRRCDCIDGHGTQLGTLREAIVCNAQHRSRQNNRVKICTTVECTITDGGHTFWYLQSFQINAFVECPMVNGLELAIWSKRDGWQATAVLEGTFVDSLHRGRDGDFG